MPLRKGQTPGNFLEMRKKAWEANKGRKPWNAGKKNVFSVETLLKMSLAKKGKPSHLKGKHRSDETKEKCRIANLGKRYSPKTEFKKGQIVGELHWNWKGGIHAERKRTFFYNRERRKRKKMVGGSHTKEQWFDLKSKYGFMCLCCKKSEPEIKLTEDHIIPLTQWNAYIKFHPEIKYQCDDMENIQPLCGSCNARKQVKIINYQQINA